MLLSPFMYYMRSLKTNAPWMTWHSVLSNSMCCLMAKASKNISSELLKSNVVVFMVKISNSECISLPKDSRLPRDVVHQAVDLFHSSLPITLTLTCMSTSFCVVCIHCRSLRKIYFLVIDSRPWFLSIWYLVQCLFSFSAVFCAWHAIKWILSSFLD